MLEKNISVVPISESNIILRDKLSLFPKILRFARAWHKIIGEYFNNFFCSLLSGDQEFWFDYPPHLVMHVIEATSFFIHSPSIPMRLKDINGTRSDVGHIPRPVPPSRDSTTIDPGHKAILEMHENSESSALFYVGVVLLLYILALIAVLSKYRRSERYENRLTRLYDDFMHRDRYLQRLPKRTTTEVPTEEVKEQKPEIRIKMGEECAVWSWFSLNGLKILFFYPKKIYMHT